MPWLQDGSIKSLWNGPEMKGLRQAFINGEQPSECIWCWKEEDNNVKSYRQNYIKYHGSDYDNIDFSTDYSTAPRVFDVKLSNVCNLKCRMCNRVASSSILKEEKTYKTFSLEEIKEQEYWLTNKILGTNNENDFMEWLPHIVQIEFTGGEPLVSPENKQLIKAISETEHAKNIRIQLTTNATHYNATLVEQLKKFKEIHVDASVDDIGPRIEYARHGTKWVNLDRNLKKYNSVKEIVFHVWATVNNYNIWYLDELINYCDENNIVIALGALHTPSEFSIQHLPDHLKDAIREKYKAFPSMSKRLEPIINFLDASGDNHIEEFLATTKQYDETRSESFKDVFPEWRDMIYYG
jgi:MoaA/NifB/PqqE/SkfB family radical SAM enzyme